MDKTIEVAKIILAQMFNINKKNFERYTTRKRIVVEARRYLIYFMVDELHIPYLHCKKYLPALTNHATAMHHYKKMRDLMKVNANGKVVEPATKEKYLHFKKGMLKASNFYISKEIAYKRDQRVQLQKEIKELEAINAYVLPSVLEQ